MAASNAAEKLNTGENFADLFESSFSSDIKEGSIIKGHVISKDKEYVVIDVGLKTEGRVALKEFSVTGDEEAINVGDEVEVYLEKFENRDGEAVISREKALREESWERFEAISEKGETVEGTIFGRVKGGFTVDLDGVVAFLPGSQVDVRPVKDIAPLVGLKQPFQILKIDRLRGNIVVSRRAIMEESRSVERDELLATINEGSILDGVVKNITDYGAFVDLGAVDGLLHVTDISWRRINHPSEVLSVGETIKVQVIKYDQSSKRISLGMKQLEESPWHNIEGRYEIGSDHTGTVTNITDYGAFVELESGVEGLVHVSEMSWTKKNLHPSKILSTSQEVKIRILDIEPVKHRISLGIKQCEKNPWQEYSENHEVGEIIKGEISNVMDFGIFISLAEGIDGLIHSSDISWSERPEEAMKSYNKGDQIEAKILALEPEKERVALGIKQLEKDPFSNAIGDGKLKKGSVATFTVTDVNENGVEVEVADGITSFIKRNDLSSDRMDQRPEKFAVGDRIDAKVTSVDEATRRVSLSIKAYEVDENKRTIAEFGSADSGASLGDILGVALDSAKTKQDESSAEKEAVAEKKAPAKKKSATKKKAADKDE